jgi:hypothetical protein
MPNEIVTTDGEVFDADVIHYDLSAVTRAEIDIQIATAKRYPRDIQRFLDQTESLACRSEKMARACMYSLPGSKTADDPDPDPIVGPSIRLAEIALHCYGNARACVRIAAEEEKFIVAQFSGMDLEKNVGIQIEVRRRIVDRRGRRFTPDVLTKTANAAGSIAYRNGVWKIIPAALVEPIFERVRQVASGGDIPIEKKRAEWLDYWTKRKVKPEDLFRVLGVTGIEGIDAGHLEQMAGWQTSLREKMTTLPELFGAAPPPEESQPPASAADKIAASLRKVRDRQKPVPPPTEPETLADFPKQADEVKTAREPGEEG